LFRRDLMNRICIEATMEEEIRNILDDLPEPMPRSCLDPLRELIEELHRRGRTYREIARILAERCEVRVSASTVYRFLDNRSRIKPQSRTYPSAHVPKMKKLSQPADTEQKIAVNSETGATSDEIQKRIAALKHRPMLAQTKSRLFDYDPDEPLHLPSKPRKNMPDR
jgi:hypothetical protein